jgi:hypothetical protein
MIIIGVDCPFKFMLSNMYMVEKKKNLKYLNATMSCW